MLHWTLAVVGLAVLAPVAAAQEAQKQFEAMEQKLTKAKAVRFQFLIDDETTRLKGTVLWAEGNRFKITYEGVIGDKAVQGDYVSDGKTILTEDGPMPADKLAPTFCKEIFRVGIQLALKAGVHRQGLDTPYELVLSEFSSPGNDKIGDRAAAVLRYQIAPPVMEGKPFACKVWVDAMTGLPLKRVVEGTREGKAYHLVETYNGWDLDPKILEGTFTIPPGNP